MGYMFYIWIIITIIAVIVEIITTDLTSFWFAIGATAALILNVFVHDDYIPIQVLVFTVVSALSIILLRPIIRKKMDTPKIPTNADSMIGKVAIVTSPIAKNIQGSVKIEGIEWTAITDNDSFEVGDLVLIDEISGNTLKIEKYETEEEK